MLFAISTSFSCFMPIEVVFMKATHMVAPTVLILVTGEPDINDI